MNIASISICLLVSSCLIGLSGSEELIGCVSRNEMTGNLKCNSTEQRIFILKGYLAHKGCHTTTTTIYDPLFQENITNYLREMCNLRTECNYKIDVQRYSNNEELQYIVLFYCNWLFPGTPVIWVQPSQTFKGSGNQFVLQSSNYPDEQPGNDFNCSISIPEYRTVSVTVKDLYPEYDNGGAWLKVSTSASSCVKSGLYVTFYSYGSIYMQAGISGLIRFFLIIQASEAGRSDQRPPNRDFEINCIGAFMKGTVQDLTPMENDYGMTKPRNDPTITPTPAEYPTTTIDVMSTSELTTSQYNFTKPGNSKTFLGAVIGASIGGVLVGAVGIAVYVLWKRNQIKRNNSDYEIPTQPDAIGSTSTEATGYTNFILPDIKDSDHYEYIDATYVNYVNHPAPIQT